MQLFKLRMIFLYFLFQREVLFGVRVSLSLWNKNFFNDDWSSTFLRKKVHKAQTLEKKLHELIIQIEIVKVCRRLRINPYTSDVYKEFLNFVTGAKRNREIKNIDHLFINGKRRYGIFDLLKQNGEVNENYTKLMIQLNKWTKFNNWINLQNRDVLAERYNPLTSPEAYEHLRISKTFKDTVRNLEEEEQ